MDSSPAIDSNPVVQELQQLQGEVYRLVKHRVEQRPLPTLVRKMILLFNGERSLVEVCELCDITLGKGRAVARKLVQHGLLVRSTGKRKAPHTPAPPQASRRPDSPEGFSWEEEAFFAADLPAVDECDLPFETLRSKANKALHKLFRR